MNLNNLRMPKFKNPIESALSASLICLQLSKSREKKVTIKKMYIMIDVFPLKRQKKDKRCRIRPAGIFCAGKSIRLGGDLASRADKKVLQFIS